MNKYLFIFTIGPVQSFISQARKGQDLFAGSRLLSDQLCLSINETIRQGHEIIFPYTDEAHAKVGVSMHLEKYDRTIPNRFVALLNLDDPEKVRAFGKDLERLLKEALIETATNVYKRYGIDITHFSIKEELEDLQEKYWAAVPYDSSLHTYSDRYQLLEQYLGATKRVRKFKQFCETGRKCSVNGLYNVKVYRKSSEEQKSTSDIIRETKLFSSGNQILDFQPKEIKLRHIQPGEGLCGISFLKRIYKEVTGTFPSTAEIALQHIIEDKDTALEIERFKNMFVDDADTQLLYDENLTPSYFKKYGIRLKDNKTLGDLKGQAGKIRGLASSKNLKISKHYAILRFDGDNMGKWLAAAKSKEEHNQLSKTLLDFSNYARDLVDNNLGRTIYAGGDDFLALVNLTHLFKTLLQLNQQLKTINTSFPIDRGGVEFSVSFSVFISHYKVPLGKALEMSENLLQKTKEKYKESDKGGTGISFFKKSGTLGEIIIKNNQISLLEKTVPYMLEEKFNPRFIYRFSAEFGHWRGENQFDSPTEFNAHLQLIESEFIRLIRRSCAKKHNLTDVESLGTQLFEELTDINAHKNRLDFSNLGNTLRILEAYNATI
jgi:CRISPR-associated protein Cmr2